PASCIAWDSTHVAVRQARVVESQAMQDAGLKVMNVDLVLDRVQSKIVCLSDHLPAFCAASREPHGITVRVMVASRLFIRPAHLAHRCSAELATPDDQGAF